MINPPKTLKTERLRLRKAKLTDAEVIFRQYAQDPEVTKYVSWRAHRNVEETREYVGMCLLAWDVGKAFHWVIERKEDNQLIGMIIARVNVEKWELGFVLARPFWGQGYMTETVRNHAWALKRKRSPHLGGLRRGQPGLRSRDGKGRHAARRDIAPLVVHPNISDDAILLLRITKQRRDGNGQR